MAYDAYDVITLPMTALSKQMMNGQPNAKHTALGEAIHRKDVDVYRWGTDDINIALGRSQEDLEASVKQLIIATLYDVPRRIVMKIHGLKPTLIKGGVSDSDGSNSDKSESDEPVKFTGKYNAAQFIPTHTVILWSAVKNKVSVKREKDEADEGKGEAFSMEDRPNSKDFRMIARIKLAAREETPEWYGIEDPGIFALSEDLKCSLCGRSGHENSTCHKFMNHIIGNALINSHPKESVRIIR
jgi:hypothetical protein